MDDKIFRKKSLEKIKSPDKLDDYIQVSNPGVWILLLSIIILLIGACCWGFFGHINSTISTDVYVEKSKAVCYVSNEDITHVKKNMVVKFNDVTSKIECINDIDGKRFECKLSLDKPVSDGEYQGEIAIQSFRPISFIFN